MKGLINKYLYMIKNYCRIYAVFFVLMFISLAFSEISYIISFLFYIPTMMIIVLMSYDERDLWDTYFNYLPVKISQVVSVKYLIGLAIIVFEVLACSLIVGIKDPTNLVNNVSGFIVLPLISMAITLPFYFWLGVNKARIAYYIIFGAIFASSQFVDNGLTIVNISNVLFVLCAIFIFVISWLLSIKLYERRLSKLR